MHLHRPEYACAILCAPGRSLLLELRDASSRHAPNQLTCFGGHREATESASQCLRRELAEEIGWQPGRLVPVLDLYRRGRWLARFYEGAFTATLGDLCVLPGRQACLVALEDLASAPVSRWHRAALEGWQQGHERVVLGD